MISVPTDLSSTYKAPTNELQNNNTSLGSRYNKNKKFDYDLENENAALSTERNLRTTKSPNGEVMEILSNEESGIDSSDLNIDKILCELRGVVIRREESIIQVKIDDLIIDFPKVLFQGITPSLQLGQRVRYQVCKKYNGLRYQKFLKETEPFQNPRIKEVTNLIESINS